MFDINYWKATAERAVKTFAQTLAALIGTNGAGLIDSSVWENLGVALTATVLSVLTSVGSSKFGPSSGPSLVNESTHPETVVVEVEVPVYVTSPAPAKKKAPAKKSTAQKTKPVTS